MKAPAARGKEIPFDPYEDWLGLAKGNRPPSHFELLGISPAEADPEVIKEAALRQTTKLRPLQLGPQAETCTRLLNEIAQARATLLNPRTRKAYDRRTAPSLSETEGLNNPEEMILEDVAAKERIERPHQATHRIGSGRTGERLALLGYLLLLVAAGFASFQLTLRHLGETSQAVLEPERGSGRTTKPSRPVTPPRDKSP